jgi:hypothetical protein
LRQRKREQLRSKATGMIRATTPATNKKVVFDEGLDADADAEIAGSVSKDDDHEPHKAPAADDDDDDAVVEAPSSPPAEIGGNKEELNNKAEGDDDDDDGVEEMTSKEARQEDLERRELERRTARVAASQTAAKKSRKRKDCSSSKAEPQPDEPRTRKDSEASSVGPDDAMAIDTYTMDESFFAELDVAREAERKERRRRRLVEDDTARPRGVHTTFVVEGETSAETQPIVKKVDHNVQVVVLPAAAPAFGDDNDVPALPPPVFASEPVSSTALVCSRGLLVDGSDVMSAKAQQKAKKNGIAHLRKDNVVPGWTRSKKMSFLASSKNRRKQGNAAPIFAVKK